MLPIEPRHDSFEGLPAWAQWTLDRHRSDFRPHRYADEQLEAGSTHDPLWNAAQRLNDRYSLDGRDLNGCVGVLWSVGGLHDRPWGEREVFGQVRFMSLDGARRKFDVEAHVRKAATPARPKSAAGTSASHRRRRERA